MKVVDCSVPSKDILKLHRVFLFLLCSHLWWGKGRRKRENKKENEESLFSSRGTTIKTHYQPAYIPKTVLPIPSHWESMVDTI